MELILIRHIRVPSVEGLCYGQLDCELPAGYEAEIQQALVNVASVDCVFSSPLRRSCVLGQALALRDGCECICDDALKELNFGAWEGRRWSDISRQDSDSWALDPWRNAPPEGETADELWQRVTSWYARTLPMMFGRVAIIAHAGPLRVLWCLTQRLSPQQFWSLSIRPGKNIVLTI